jgi:uncharacterized iron-regulated membrane protein
MKNSSTFTISWLHSWSGLLFGWLLFTVFLTGTLTVFDNEITAWMQPELQEVTWDTDHSNGAAPRLMEVGWQVEPEDRGLTSDGPMILQVKLQDRRTFSGQTIHPVTGELVTFRDTQGGDFFYHFHYGLLAGWPGAWTVGAAAIAMVLTLVTGLGVQRRISNDVLAFRAWSLSHRAWVDIHNLTGMLVLPFHLMMTVTGLVIFWAIYMPVEAPFLFVNEQILSLVSLLHFVRFGGSTMRWLYFVMGLLASGVIATGLVLWTGKRRKYYAGSALGIGVVEVLNVSAMGGLLVAIAVFFWANRLLPASLIDRSLWEIRCFFLAWCLCLVHSLFRTGSLLAWRDQLYGAAVLLGCLPLLNGLTTKSHLLMTVPRGQWALVGVDVTALLAGTLLAATARRIGQAARTK